MCSIKPSLDLTREREREVEREREREARDKERGREKGKRKRGREREEREGGDKDRGREKGKTEREKREREKERKGRERIVRSIYVSNHSVHVPCRLTHRQSVLFHHFLCPTLPCIHLSACGIFLYYTFYTLYSIL